MLIYFESKRFFASPRFYLPVLVLFSVYLFRIFRFWPWLTESLEHSGSINMTFLHVPAEQSVLLFCFFLFFTYFWGREAEQVHFAEIFQSVSNGRRKQVAQITRLPFLILLLLVVVTLSFSLFWAYRLNDLGGRFTLYLFAFLIWYVGICPSVAILIGTAFALTLAEDIAYPIEMMMALIVSGLGNHMLAYLLPSSFLFGKTGISSFFRLSPFGVESAPIGNALYPLLPGQLAKLGTLMVMAGGVILFYIFRGRIKRIVLVGSLGILLLFLFFQGQQTISTPPFDRQDRFADEEYYVAHQQIEQPSNFHLREIVARIHFGNQLEATAQCTLEDMQAGLQTMTLYHGYQVHEVKLDGEDIEFSQEQDYIFFSSETSRQQAVVELTYSGMHPLYYANAQSVFLPAYIPWLPMPGAMPVYDVEYKHFQINRYPEEVLFHLELSGCSSLACSLNQLNDGTWEGKSDGVSLYGGFIQQKTVNGNVWVASQFEDLAEYSGILQDQEKELKEFQLELPDMSRTIFTTGNIVRDVDEQVVKMQDHTLVNNIKSQAKNVMHSLVPKEQRREHMYVFAFVPPVSMDPYRTAEAVRDETANGKDEDLHEFLSILLEKLSVYGEEKIIPALRYYFYHPELQNGQKPVDFIRKLNPEEP